MRPHVDAALRLRDLRFAPWSSDGGTRQQTKRWS